MTTPYSLPPLAGLRIEVSQHLVGAKHALQFGDGPVYVSPAMWELFKSATPDELKTLLETIHIRRLPDMRLDFSLPMTMCAPPAGDYNYAARMIDMAAFARRAGT